MRLVVKSPKKKLYCTEKVMESSSEYVAMFELIVLSPYQNIYYTMEL